MEDTASAIDTSAVIQEEELVLDSKGNAIKQTPKQIQTPKTDLKSQAKNEFSRAKEEILGSKSVDTSTETIPEKLEPKKYKIKYNGKEEEIEADDNTIVEALQKARDYTRKTQEAAEARKQAESVFKLLENLKNDPHQIFDFGKQYLGHDLEQIAEQKLLEKVKYELMSPEERQQYDLTKENSTLKMELDKRRKAEEALALQEKQAKEQQEKQAQENEFANSLGEFFDSKGISTQDSRFLPTLELLYRYWDSPKPLSIEQAWNKVNEQESIRKSEVLKNLKIEDIPEELKKALRQADVDRIKTNRPWKNSKPEQTSKPESRKTMTSEEYFRQMEKQFK